jgi:3-(3-hydroxy-phenyl)propionate hydroxylase
LPRSGVIRHHTLTMLNTYTWPRYAYRRAPELNRRAPLVIVGAGMVGLAAAIDAAQRGLPVIVLDDDNTVSVGSRAVCHAKRTLEILDRLGVGQRVVDKGITWNVGRTFDGEREVFSFNLLPEPGHERPGMVNLQQYHLEQFLVERAQSLGVDLRWQHKVAGVMQHDGHVALAIDTADGRYTLEAEWLIAADGVKSTVRKLLGLEMAGQVFQDRFLIADIVLDGDPYPADKTERRFWFNPPFHQGESALMHREADNVWRLDFQLGNDIDVETEKDPERVRTRVRAALDQQGFANMGFELEWVSIYTFQCRRMQRFVHGRVLFAGDSAHQVSPFGARGGNSGIQDADNLVWKLARVIRGESPASLLESYDAERGAATDDNIANSTRATDFMTPKSRAARALREAVLGLAGTVPAMRALINSGRLSVPTWLVHSPLNTPDAEHFAGWMVPGAPLDDAPVVLANGASGWLLRCLPPGFVLLHFGAMSGAARDLCRELGIAPLVVGDDVRDRDGLLAQRLAATDGTVYLLRPDQHVAARWRRFDAQALRAAFDTATH